MEEESKITHIGFPAPLLGDEAQRLPVLAKGDGWLVLRKPAGVLIDAHPWYPGLPSLVAGLRVQVEAGKPELMPFGISHAASVYFLDPEIEGAALLALNRTSMAELRNLVGSSLVTFRYRFFVRKQPMEESCECHLPLQNDDGNRCAMVNRKRGKKSHTAFKRIADYGICAEWEAWTTFPRPHQVRLHAQECGFSIIGDERYGGSSSPLRGDLMGKRAGDRAAAPLFSGLAMCLTAVELPEVIVDGGVWKDADNARRLLLGEKKSPASGKHPRRGDR